MRDKSTEYSYQLFQRTPDGYCILVREDMATGAVQASNLFALGSREAISVNVGSYTRQNWRWFVNHEQEFVLRATLKQPRASQLQKRLIDV